MIGPRTRRENARIVALRARYESIGAGPGRIAATILCMGALFFLVDPDAEIAVTMASRALTEDEWQMYSASPGANRRRKPGSTIDDDEERARRKRVVALMQEIHDS